MIPDDVYTLEEVSQHLRVPVDAVRQEIISGRLEALDIAGFIRVRESDLARYKNEAKAVLTSVKSEEKDQNSLHLNPAPDFTYTWPDKTVERYTDVREGIARYGSKEYHVKLGFTFRNSAGRRRRRCLVLVDRYATVEFVASDEKTDGRMASIIRDRDGKQLPVGATLPPEYDGLPVGPYRKIVVGAGASNGMAVECESQDFDTMVKHALIRYRFRKERA